ncbi:MAG: hypothetical protein ABI051_01970 [Vicinamibacterales bacterium]
MFSPRHLILAAALAVAAPGASGAAPVQWPWSGSSNNQQVAYNQGYDRGLNAGVEDVRRGDQYKFTDESDYKKGDVGYRSTYGNRDRYRDDFRRGFEAGYRVGYDRNGTYNDRGPQGRLGVPPPWSNGRGRQNDGRGIIGNGRAMGRYDLAAQNGYNDGYEAGLRDAQSRRQFDPVSEGRYRSGDRGYEKTYGTRELYKANYRESFRVGYEEGYNDGRRYSGR